MLAAEANAGATGTLANDEWVRLGVVGTPSGFSFYIDGAKVYTSDSTVVSDQACYPVLLLTTSAAGANAFKVDYFACSGERPA